MPGPLEISTATPEELEDLREGLGAVGGTGCSAIVVLAQAAYDALETKNPTTLYLITED